VFTNWVNELSYYDRMPRFVLLRHEMPVSHVRAAHFDLMLEADGVLVTWAASGLPEKGAAIEAERLADHRLKYLEYEGPISGDRGSVRRVDCGDFEWIERQPARCEAQMFGETLRGRLVIERMDAEAQRWRVVVSD
jgi:hypothetical protein